MSVTQTVEVYPLDRPPMISGWYLVGHRGYQEIWYYYAPDRDWTPNVQLGWHRRDHDFNRAQDPAKAYKAKYWATMPNFDVNLDPEPPLGG